VYFYFRSFFVLFNLIFISGFSHTDEEVFVEINGKTVSLREALNFDYLVEYSGVSPSSGLSLPVFSHTGDDVYVYITSPASMIGSSTDLQSVINSQGHLCSFGSGLYSGEIHIGHKADNIDLSSGKTLQEAIDDGDFCCVPDCSCASSICIDDTCSDGCRGTCSGSLSPDCGTRVCGPAPNGCGSSDECGTCSSDETCSGGSCVSTCTESCSGDLGCMSSGTSNSHVTSGNCCTSGQECYTCDSGYYWDGSSCTLSCVESCSGDLGCRSSGTSNSHVTSGNCCTSGQECYTCL